MPDYTGRTSDLTPDQDHCPPVDRARLFETLRPYFARAGVEVNWQAFDTYSDVGLVNALAMICPFEPPEKQALLETGSPADRLDLLVTLAHMGVHDTGTGPSGALRQ